MDRIALLAILPTVAAAQGVASTESNVFCGEYWMSFPLPRITQEERQGLRFTVANDRTKDTILAIPRLPSEMRFYTG